VCVVLRQRMLKLWRAQAGFRTMSLRRHTPNHQASMRAQENTPQNARLLVLVKRRKSSVSVKQSPGPASHTHVRARCAALHMRTTQTRRYSLLMARHKRQTLRHSAQNTQNVESPHNHEQSQAPTAHTNAHTCGTHAASGHVKLFARAGTRQCKAVQGRF
jgi:hypothetical protein